MAREIQKLGDTELRRWVKSGKPIAVADGGGDIHECADPTPPRENPPEPRPHTAAATKRCAKRSAPAPQPGMAGQAG